MTETTGRAATPRWGTPRNPDRPTRGDQVAEVARRMGAPMMPWQRHCADVLHEYDPDTGENIYDTGDVGVMRQCGKTMGFAVPNLVHRCTMVVRRLGRQQVGFLMHDRQKAREKLEHDIIPTLDAAADSFRRITNPKGRPGRSQQEWKSSLNNGNEHILFGRSARLKIDTPSKKATHSNTLDMVALDEIRFYVDDRVEAAVRPTMITRPDRMLLRTSTAGDEDSVYFWAIVVGGRQEVEAGIQTRRAYFEWSIPDDADLHDPDVWLEYHPAIGYTIRLEDILAELHAAEMSPDERKMDTFRQEFANQWVRHPVLGAGTSDQLMAPQVWAARTDPNPRFASPTVLGVAVAEDGRSSALVLAGWTGDDHGLVRVLDVQAGTFWVEAELAAAIKTHEPDVVTFDAGGPTNAISGAIGRAAGSTPVEPITGTAYASACSAWVTGFTEGHYRHADQEWLTTAMLAAKRKWRGERWVWDLSASSVDLSPLVAGTCAFRALEGRPPQPRSAYESGDLITI